MKLNNLTIFFIIIIHSCITFINLAPILFILYFALNQIQHIQNMQNISNDFEIFNRLDSGIYG
jgi:hypothetical protein